MVPVASKKIEQGATLGIKVSDLSKVFGIFLPGFWGVDKSWR